MWSRMTATASAPVTRMETATWRSSGAWRMTSPNSGPSARRAAARIVCREAGRASPEAPARLASMAAPSSFKGQARPPASMRRRPTLIGSRTRARSAASCGGGVGLRNVWAEWVSGEHQYCLPDVFGWESRSRLARLNLSIAVSRRLRA